MERRREASHGSSPFPRLAPAGAADIGDLRFRDPGRRGGLGGAARRPSAPASASAIADCRAIRLCRRGRRMPDEPGRPAARPGGAADRRAAAAVARRRRAGDGQRHRGSGARRPVLDPHLRPPPRLPAGDPQLQALRRADRARGTYRPRLRHRAPRRGDGRRAPFPQRPLFPRRCRACACACRAGWRRAGCGSAMSTATTACSPSCSRSPTPGSASWSARPRCSASWPGDGGVSR